MDLRESICRMLSEELLRPLDRRIDMVSTGPLGSTAPRSPMVKVWRNLKSIAVEEIDGTYNCVLVEIYLHPEHIIIHSTVANLDDVHVAYCHPTLIETVLAQVKCNIAYHYVCVPRSPWW